MRMNTTKELIAVAFSPTSESSDVGFRILSDVLIAKGYVNDFFSLSPFTYSFPTPAAMALYFPGDIILKIIIQGVSYT